MSIKQSFRFTFIIFFAAIALIFSIAANAQDDPNAEPTPIETPDTPSEAELAEQDTQAQELADLDENITAADFGVGDPDILPGSPFYGFKNFSRGMQSFFTFNPVKKAELKIKFSNEKLIEAKKLEEQGIDDEALKNALDNYGQEVARVKTQIEKLKGTADKTKIESLIKETADSQIKQHKMLGKIMRDREDIAPEIEQKKADAMKRLSESMASVVDPEVLQQKFEEVMREQKGSSFKHFKHIEMLEEVKDNVPDAAKGAIQNAIEQSSKFFEEEFSSIDKEERDLFNKYIEKTGGNEVRHLEAFDSLNAFADIEKEMFEEMEKAREKARTRVERRMRNIKDETRKNVFVAHLEEGKMEDARIVNELESNLAPETITSILDVKHKMQEKMREKFENAESVGDLDNFFGEIEDRPDVQMLSMMDKMEQLIPEDKKDFWQEMKKKALTEMQSNMDQARRFGRLEDETRMLAGFEPEDMQTLDKFEGEFGPEFDFFKDIRGEQAGRIQDRFEHFNEFAGQRPKDSAFFEKAEQFRLRIQVDPDSLRDIRQFAPGINQHFQDFDIQRDAHGFAGEDINLKLEKANTLIQKLSALVENSAESAPGLEAARTHLKNAQAHLEKARTALVSDNTGEAFGQVVSAIQNAANGIRRLETDGFETEQLRYFQQRDEVRFEFRDVPQDQLPDFNQFINMKPPMFEDFSRPEFFHEDVMCSEVITPARERLTGYCKVFPNSCLPPGWIQDQTCKMSQDVVDGTPNFIQPTTQIQIAPTIDYQHLLEEKQRLLEQYTEPAPTEPVDQIVCPSYDIMRFTQECSQKGGIVEKKFDQNCGYLPYCHLPSVTKPATTAPTYTEPTYTEPAPEPVACPSYDMIAFSRDCSARGGSVVKKYDQRCGYVPECVLPTATEPAPTYQNPDYNYSY